MRTSATAPSRQSQSGGLSTDGSAPYVTVSGGCPAVAVRVAESTNSSSTTTVGRSADGSTFQPTGTLRCHSPVASSCTARHAWSLTHSRSTPQLVTISNVVGVAGATVLSGPRNAAGIEVEAGVDVVVASTEVVGDSAACGPQAAVTATSAITKAVASRRAVLMRLRRCQTRPRFRKCGPSAFRTFRDAHHVTRGEQQ